MKRNSQSGVALVITLIFLAVITFMAISFLVLSRREAQSAVTLTVQNHAKNAADMAYEYALAQVSVQMLSKTNGFGFVMLVSTNLDQPFLPAGTNNDVANVSYFDANTNLLPQAAFLRNLTNLQILPRAPVFIKTVDAANRPTNEFRFFLDLNRNLRFDPSGYVTVLDDFGKPVPDASGNPTTNFVTGDPQWVGVLEHPDQPHSSSNKFVARYCYLALPIGNSLDINAIHNQSKAIKAGNDILDGGYYRNENVGTWELNLAGFLASLNANVWNPARKLAVNYQYNSGVNNSSSGYAFDDAASILQVRYNNNYNSLNSFAQLYPAATAMFQTNNIDAYTRGFLMTGFFPPAQNPTLTVPWSGSASPNAFYTPGDIFNLVPQINPANSFYYRLSLVGQGLSTYNQYTYYRMLQQMSFDSAPESARTAMVVTNINGNYFQTNIPASPLNLDYINVNGHSVTNFTPWTISTAAANGASMFFTNCADRLIRQAFPNSVVYYANGVANVVTLSATNIPLYPVNFYTPAMHRLLQLAANIYDASSSRALDAQSVAQGLSYPSVFRPVFSKNGTNIFISGYVEEIPSMKSYNSIPLSLPDDLTQVTAQVPNFPATTPLAANAMNLYSAPWVLGAKKGFPNFNQFVMESVVQLTRKLQVNKVAAGTPRSGWLTNQMYVIGVSNLLGVEAWNSYMTNFNRSLQLVGVDYLTMTLANDLGIRVTTFLNNGQLNWFTNIPANQWSGFKDPLHPSTPSKNSASFLVPFQSNVVFVPDSIWRQTAATLEPVNSTPNPLFESSHKFPLPRFSLNITNRLRYIMLDSATKRIVDYVQLDGINSVQDLLAETTQLSSQTFLGAQSSAAVDTVWLTNRPGGTTSVLTPTVGILNQLNISAGTPALLASDWFNTQLPGANSTSETTKFNAFLNSPATNGNLVAQAPYSPTRKMTFQFMLQANDPLVHYTTGDLGITNYLAYLPPVLTTRVALTNFGGLSTRYAPWLSFRGGNSTTDTNLAVKDPLIRCSDDWQFPNNVFANLGWLGRVHRGTPWQTVYLKSSVASVQDWEAYSGHTNIFIAALTHPINDWRILDLFTTAPNDNATRGQMSINNTNEAAWHAVLDGLLVITNTGNSTFAPLIVDPNVNATALSAIINGAGGINDMRWHYPIGIDLNGNIVTNTSGTFSSLGQILSVPQLTVQSPFLNTSIGGGALFAPPASPIIPNQPLLSDAAYERIPQQTLSLLRVGTPRYVIFAFGQSLKPADHSVYQGGSPYFGLVTNYAIASEYVSRTVVDFPDQIMPPSQVINVVPPSLNATTNYPAPYIVALPPAAPPKAVARSFSPIGPQ